MSRLGRLIDSSIMLIEATIERLGDPDFSRCSKERRLRIDSEWMEARKYITELEDRLDELSAENHDLRSKLGNQIVDSPSNDGSCVCGTIFRTAEDFRDHLPCESETLWKQWAAASHQG